MARGVHEVHVLAIESDSLGNFVCAFVFDAFSDFLSVNGNVFGRVNANANLHTLNPEHGHGNVPPDLDGLTDPTREDKHSRLPFQ
jgi:hypothetical protein